MTHAEIRAAATDEIALVCTLYGEAAGESVAGQIAVANVIRNRVRSSVKWWGKDWKSVCLAPSQFSCWWESATNTDRVYELAEALVAGLPARDGEIVAQLRWIAAGVMTGAARDNTRGADSYVTAALLHRDPPNWTKTAKPLGQIDSHAFFRVAA